MCTGAGKAPEGDKQQRPRKYAFNKHQRMHMWRCSTPWSTEIETKEKARPERLFAAESVIVTNNKLPASGACSRKCRCSQPARRLRGAGALAAQALRARGPSGVSVAPSVASGGGVPTDDERATGLQREVMLAARKGLDPYNMLAPKAAASGTQEDPNLVPSITSKRRAGCICDEANSAVIWVRLHKGEAQRGPSSGTHYKLVPHQLAH
nr:cytochrome c oxidase subunit 5B, mitochondrial-like [Kogia breviceps]